VSSGGVIQLDGLALISAGLFRRFAAVFATGLALFFAAGGAVVAAAFFAGINGG
jgi:hypothetical protein